MAEEGNVFWKLIEGVKFTPKLHLSGIVQADDSGWIWKLAAGNPFLKTWIENGVPFVGVVGGYEIRQQLNQMGFRFDGIQKAHKMNAEAFKQSPNLVQNLQSLGVNTSAANSLLNPKPVVPQPAAIAPATMENAQDRQIVGGFKLTPKGTAIQARPTGEAIGLLQSMGFKNDFVQRPDLFFCNKDLFTRNAVDPRFAPAIQSLKQHGFDVAAMAQTLGVVEQPEAAPEVDPNARGKGGLQLTSSGRYIGMDRSHRNENDMDLMSSLREFGFFHNVHADNALVMGKNELVSKFFPKGKNTFDQLDVLRAANLKKKFDIDPVAMADWLVSSGQVKVTGPQQKNREKLNDLMGTLGLNEKPPVQVADKTHAPQELSDPNNVNRDVSRWMLFNYKDNKNKFVALGQVQTDNPMDDKWKIVEPFNGQLMEKPISRADITTVFEPFKLNEQFVNGSSAQEVLQKAPQVEPENVEDQNWKFRIAKSKVEPNQFFVVMPYGANFGLRSIADQSKTESVPVAAFDTKYEWVLSPATGKPVEAQSEKEANDYAKMFLMEATGQYEELRKKNTLDYNTQLTPEGRAIDDRFASMYAGIGKEPPSHQMINALAGTGKTTNLKHLAWKYGKPGDKFLYLVFNRKNMQEASEVFPPWVQVLTSNSFLGTFCNKSTTAVLPSTNRFAKNSKVTDKVPLLLADPARRKNGGMPFPQLTWKQCFPNARISSPNFDEDAIAPYQGDGENWVNPNTVRWIIRTLALGLTKTIVKIAKLAKANAISVREGDAKTISDINELIVKNYDVTDEIADRMADFGVKAGKDPRMLKAIQVASQMLGLMSVTEYVASQQYMPAVVSVANETMKDSVPGQTNAQYTYSYGQEEGKTINLSEYRGMNDDMWLPALMQDHVTWPHYDVVMADEVQDFNRCQLLMLLKLHEAGARIVAVGDPNQAIYRFNGADADSFKNIGAMLFETSTDKQVMQGLTENFRSAPNILNYTNENTECMKKRPENDRLRSGRKWTPENAGIVTEQLFDEGDMLSHISEELENAKRTGQPMKQSAILCRTNSPLAQVAMNLLGKGIPFILAGKEFDKEVVKAVESIIKAYNDVVYQEDSEKIRRRQIGKHQRRPRFDPNSMMMGGDPNVDPFIKAVDYYVRSEVEPLKSMPQYADLHRERLEHVQAVQGAAQQYVKTLGGNAQATVASFQQWLEKNLQGMDVEDEREGKQFAAKMEAEKASPIKSVILSSSHKSKGLQFPTVYVMRPELFPSKKAKTDADLVQEDNLLYITYSRAENELHVLKSADDAGETGLNRSPEEQKMQPPRIRQAGVWNAGNAKMQNAPVAPAAPPVPTPQGQA